MRKESDIKERYHKLGGLPSVIESYQAGKLNLKEISEAIGYSKETIRNDIKRQVGESGFNQLMAKKYETRRAQTEVSMDISEAIKYLAGLMREANKTSKQELLVVAQVLGEINKMGVPLSMSITRYGAMRFALADGTPVGIRVGVVDGSLQEHEKGIYRFKTSPKTSEREFSIFAIRDGNKTVFYLFAPSELGDVRSLNLRYTDESKYDMERKSKYDYARDRWSILKRRVR